MMGMGGMEPEIRSGPSRAHLLAGSRPSPLARLFLVVAPAVYSASLLVPAGPIRYFSNLA